MNDKSKDLMIDELSQKLDQANEETVKYVNKFLEAEEKWNFINILIKKLNSIKDKQELCKTICDGFLKLTNSKVCACCLFNPETNNIEIEKISYNGRIKEKKIVTNFVEEVNTKCHELLVKTSDIKDLLKYFKSFGKKQIIISPIIYNENFLGYLALAKEANNFYKENAVFVNIFPEHIALILENISLYQESQKQNRHKIEFLAGISHEFKTPLNSIIGFSEILKSKSEHVDDLKYLENISQSSRHLLTLIEDVLDVSKTEYKNLELNYTTFRPKTVIMQIVTTLEEIIKEKNLNLTYTLTDVEISADIKRFRQLIYNLVTNAIKFNKQDGEINIFTYMKEDDFIFEIIDTGDGICKKDYEKIFNFFSQVNRSQLKRQLGSGVGLALCKRITDAHKGKINFKSQLDKGTHFWFSLPMGKIAEKV